MENKYNFENLVLLVGTNPLPNYVVGKYFLITNPHLKKIWLVYSEKKNDFGTKEIAEKIEKVFNKKDLIEFCPLEKISDARDINRNVESNILERLVKMDHKTVHLNYTGGTKAMAVHVYRTIEKYEKISNSEKSYSYLDARGFVLTDDEKGKVTEDLRKIINDNCRTFSFDILINLHGYQKKSKGSEYCEEWNEVLEEFKKLIDENRLEEYLKWKKLIRKIFYIKKNEKEIIDTNINRINSKIKERLDFNGGSYNFEEHPFKNYALKILNKMPTADYLLKNNELYISDSIIKKQLISSIEFLDGKWLENYVFQILKRNLKLNSIHVPLELNWILEKQNVTKDDKDFELDIILLNGYQIYGISITTDNDEGRCKSKGFEIIHRVNQIGGEESKAILVTCLAHEKAKKLEDDLKAETSSKERLIVSGIEDIPEYKIYTKISEFIEPKEAACK